MCWQTNSLQAQINERLQQIQEAQKEVLMMQE
jgi:exonuclease III